MRIDEIRNALHAQPFQPFGIRTSDGRGYFVRHPDFLAILPSGRAIIVTHSQDLWDVLDLLHISGIHFGDGHRGRVTGRRRR